MVEGLCSEDMPLRGAYILLLILWGPSSKKKQSMISISAACHFQHEEIRPLRQGSGLPCVGVVGVRR